MVKVTSASIAVRDAFFDSLYEIAQEDHRVILVSADCGAPSLDKFRKDLKGQYVNVGIAEQNMVSIAAGLALGGKIVYMYAIAPFVTLRCYEQIKVDLCCMNLPVTGLGVGAGYAYDIMGPTHHATEDVSIMRSLPGMTILNPSDSIMAAAFAQVTYQLPGPKYVRFDRAGLPLIYQNKRTDFLDGLTLLRAGKDLCIIATGVMVHRALKLAQELSRHSLDAGVVDLYRLKPINEELLLKCLEGSPPVITLEEHFLTGGMGSAVLEILNDKGNRLPLLRLGLLDRYMFEYGGREHLHALNKLDDKSIVEKVLEWASKK